MHITVKNIIEAFPPLKIEGNVNSAVNSMIQLNADNTQRDVVCWCNSKNIHQLNTIKVGTVIVPIEAQAINLNSNCTYIFVENPRLYFMNVLKEFFWKNDFQAFISERASISVSAKIGKNVFIADGVVIENNCTVGENVKILHNTIIGANTVIGDNVMIGANNVIGNHGFGYEKSNKDYYSLMPHIGNVIIGSFVEIGNNNCIDRAVLGSTTIKQHTKIHNLVQIAHGVQIGENCLVTAQVTISGSTSIGDDVWLGPGVTIANKLKIGNSAYLGIGCVVVSDVPHEAKVFGNPARIIKSEKS